MDFGNSIMSLISVDNVSLKFSGLKLLDNISLQINKNEKICLMGRNGTGKTTFLKVLAGLIEPDEGSVHKNSDVKVSYFSQNIEQENDQDAYSIITSKAGSDGKLICEYNRLLNSELSDPQTIEYVEQLRQKVDSLNAWRYIDKCNQIMKSLRIQPDMNYNKLSGGWKRRVLLAAALASGPDVLLLDEPTNHLDISTIEWLEDYLLKSEMTIVFVTHDRRLLKRLAGRIVEISCGCVYDWKTDYETFLKRRDELLAAMQKDNERFDKKLAKEEVWIRKGIQARQTRNEGRVRALKKMRQERLERKVPLEKVKLDINKAQRSGLDVINARAVSFSWNQEQIVNNLTATIRRSDKIGIVGPNGCGKTTLVKLLTKELQPDSGEVVHGTNLEVIYFDQLREQLDENKTIWQNVLPLGETVLINDNDVHIVSYLQKFLFSSDRIHAKVKVLSGGEKNRVLLARLFAKPSNMIVLDEPTNDLDIETLQLLEEILLEYKGTVLLICHDREFIDSICQSIMYFTDNNEVKEIVGGYDDYAMLTKQKSLNGLIDSNKKTTTKKVAAAPRKKTQLSFNEKKELEQLHDLIEKTEQQLQKINIELSDPEFYKQNSNAAKTVIKREELECSLETMLERWEELETKKIASKT